MTDYRRTSYVCVTGAQRDARSIRVIERWLHSSAIGLSRIYDVKIPQALCDAMECSQPNPKALFREQEQLTTQAPWPFEQDKQLINLAASWYYACPIYYSPFSFSNSSIQCHRHGTPTVPKSPEQTPIAQVLGTSVPASRGPSTKASRIKIRRRQKLDHSDLTRLACCRDTEVHCIRTRVL